ncbi:unnamed protein product [Mytilus coruscus]|uniref:Uncharacterized protein n=1 Tax=Mytilus coruscus TaxID=42192 RepID=A0A6J8CQL3_MYTCO|nr:unnamed protein product [Mytilus coruscus]
MVNTKTSTKGNCILKQECIPWNKSMDTGHAGTTSTDKTLCTDTDYTAKNNSALKVSGVSCVSFNDLSLLSSSDSFDSSAASYLSDSSNLHPNSEPIRFSRPEKTLYDEALKTEAKWADCKSGEVIFLPTKLRPQKRENHNHDEIEIDIADDENENLIVSVNKLSAAITAFLLHFWVKKKCKSLNPTIQVTERKGICVSTTVSCRNCKFK